MAQIAVAATVASSVLSASSQMQAASQTEAAGRAQQQAAVYEAQQLEQRAGQERAVAQRRAMEKRRQERIAQSNLTARAAASGAGATDPTVLDLSGDIAAQGEYQALNELWIGEERAIGNLSAASLRRFEGDQAYSASRSTARSQRTGAIASLLSGFAQGGSLYSKYGGAGRNIGRPSTSGTITGYPTRNPYGNYG